MGDRSCVSLTFVMSSKTACATWDCSENVSVLRQSAGRWLWWWYHITNWDWCYAPCKCLVLKIKCAPLWMICSQPKISSGLDPSGLDPRLDPGSISTQSHLIPILMTAPITHSFCPSRFYDPQHNLLGICGSMILTFLFQYQRSWLDPVRQVNLSSSLYRTLATVGLCYVLTIRLG